MILIIDYGLGNTHSIHAKIQQMGEKCIISSDISDVESADKLILPGVGSFDAGIKNIEDLGLTEIITRSVKNKKTPILGICLGMQLFAKKSEEGNSSGFSFIDAEVKKFDLDSKLFKIPHMGWNTLRIDEDSDIVRSLSDFARFYFVHSYHMVCYCPCDVVAKTTYCYDFPSIIQKENIIGVQFHPEKSHSAGKQLLQNFINL